MSEEQPSENPYLSFQAFIKEVTKAGAANPNWRYGQTLFQVLYRLHPDKANEIRGTELDPFYTHDRERIRKFMSWVTHNVFDLD